MTEAGGAVEGFNVLGFVCLNVMNNCDTFSCFFLFFESFFFVVI